MKNRLVLSILAIAMMSTSCTKPMNGNAEIRVGYTANGQPLMLDSLCYTNEAGNRFMVNEIQWFISKVALISEQGDEYSLGKVFYFDTNLPETQIIATSSIPCQKYTSMRFTFGLDQEDNVTGLFPDPPENNMFWPDHLGGGYHYMKLNGWYLNPNDSLIPMNIHLGIGQNEDQSVFYQNYFTVELPLDLNLEEGATNVIHLNMNIDNWFRNPHTYDINVLGGAIMQNQEAQQILKENGHDVFEVSTDESQTLRIARAIQDICRKASPKPHFFSLKKS